MPIRSPSAVPCREADPQEAVDRLRKLQLAGREQTSGRVQPIDREWIAVPSPLLCPESAETLGRRMWSCWQCRPENG